MSTIRTKRCAIYTRKSSDERREACFTTLQNQREYCAAYILSQSGEGWAELPRHFDDGGCSGGTLTRPALKQLRAEIAERCVDVVLVYKIDRLSRSLRDFANLLVEFEAAGVTFVSVTQALDTATSMGRLTLNMLLSFAQFERELTGERLREWFAGARAQGLWVSERPYGYAKINGNHLFPHPTEAAVVKRIFKRYCALGSCRLVADELFADGILNKSGRPWSGCMVLHTIKHRVYRGEIVHRRAGLPGKHEAIISEQLWKRAHRVFELSRWSRRALVEPPVPAMLKGLIFDRIGHRLHHTFIRSRSHLNRYYIAGAERLRSGGGSDSYMRFRADDLEHSVLAIVDRLAGVSRSVRSRQEMIELVRRYVERIDIGLDNMRVVFRTGVIVTAEAAGRLGNRQHRLDACKPSNANPSAPTIKGS